MKHLLLSGFLLSTAICLSAQNSAKTSLSHLQSQGQIDIRYQYPTFLPGKVFYKDGTAGGGLLNYNMLVGEIQFIDQDGDTMALKDMPTIKYLTIAEDSFYYSKGILRILGDYAPAKLAVKDILLIKDRQKLGAYGMTAPGGSIDSYNAIRVSHGTYRLGVDENLVIGKESTYFLMAKENHFLPVNVQNIGKLFPSRKEQVQQYIVSEHLSLNKEEDIRKVLSFCTSK